MLKSKIQETIFSLKILKIIRSKNQKIQKKIKFFPKFSEVFQMTESVTGGNLGALSVSLRDSKNPVESLRICLSETFYELVF